VTEERPLDFDELVGELREFARRVVALEIRDEDKNEIARAEGEFVDLEEAATGEWSFRVGGGAARLREGIRFEQASWIGIHIDARRVLEVRDISTGIGPTIVLRIRLAGGITVTLWPAMPPEQQWTDRHFDDR
jgi:hypothetical protein